jgi:hypothetical protein
MSIVLGSGIVSENEPWWHSFWVQQPLALWGGFWLSLPVNIFWNQLLQVSLSIREDQLSEWVYFPLWAAVSLTLGYNLQRRSPIPIRVGTKLWMLPVFVFLFSFLMDGLTLSFAAAADEFLALSADAGLVLIVMTGPVLAACFYSIGMVLAQRQARASTGVPS